MSGKYWIACALVWIGIGGEQSGKAADAEGERGLEGMAAPGGMGDLFQMSDGSMMHGRLLDLDFDRGASWEYASSKEPIRFSPDALEWIRFQPLQSSKSLFGGMQRGCRFRFRNGDEVYGNLIGFDQEKFEMTTWTGDPLVAPRKEMESLTFFPPGYEVFYEGPEGLEGWDLGRQKERSWDFQDGTLIATGTGTLGRFFPEMNGSCSIEFDLSWDGSLSLAVIVYSSIIDYVNYQDSSYRFYFRPGFVRAQRIEERERPISMGEAAFGDIPLPIHVELRGNQRSRTWSLLINDELKYTWLDTSAYLNKGTGLIFMKQFRDAIVRISNLKIARWDGDFLADQANELPSDKDFAFLMNRDEVEGEFTSLYGDRLKMKTEFVDLEIPVDRVTQMYFKETEVEDRPEVSRLVRAHFFGGGALAFELEQWDGDAVIGKSPVFGHLEFKPSNVRRLDFNLTREIFYRKKRALEEEDPYRVFFE